MIFTKNDESSESLHSKWWKSDNKMQTQENDMSTSALNKSNISASNVDQSINISSELKYDSSSSKKNKIISSHRDSMSWVEQHEATVSSSSQQTKSQQCWKRDTYAHTYAHTYEHTYAHTYISTISYFRFDRSDLTLKIFIHSFTSFFICMLYHMFYLLDSQYIYMHIFALTLIY